MCYYYEHSFFIYVIVYYFFLLFVCLYFRLIFDSVTLSVFWFGFYFLKFFKLYSVIFTVCCVRFLVLYTTVVDHYINHLKFFGQLYSFDVVIVVILESLQLHSSKQFFEQLFLNNSFNKPFIARLLL